MCAEGLLHNPCRLLPASVTCLKVSTTPTLTVSREEEDAYRTASARVYAAAP